MYRVWRLVPAGGANPMTDPMKELAESLGQLIFWSIVSGIALGIIVLLDYLGMAS
jgi:hypothetical protein